MAGRALICIKVVISKLLSYFVTTISSLDLAVERSSSAAEAMRDNDYPSSRAFM